MQPRDPPAQPEKGPGGGGQEPGVDLDALGFKSSSVTSVAYALGGEGKQDAAATRIHAAARTHATDAQAAGKQDAAAESGAFLFPLPAAAGTAAASFHFPGQKVELHGLSATALNGQRGALVQFDAGNGRWQVDLPGVGVKAIKPSNFVCVEAPAET